MTTLDMLISQYGGLVDRSLITAIWAEMSHDQDKCHSIVRMLSGQPVSDMRAPSESITSSVSEYQSMEGLSSTTSNSFAGRSASPSLRTPHSSAAQGDDNGDGVSGLEAIRSPEVLVDFLCACFPECGPDYLQTKVRETFPMHDKFQVDPIEAIDIISNAFYNDVETVEDQQYRSEAGGPTVSQASTSTSLEAIEAQYSVSAPKGKKAQRKEWQRKQQERPKTKSGTGADYSGASNAWGEISGELEAICAAFPMFSIGTVKSTYHRSGADLDRTIDELSAQAERLPSNSKQAAGKRNGTGTTGRAPLTVPAAAVSEEQVAAFVRDLKALFPDTDHSVLEQAARESKNDMNTAIDKALTPSAPKQEPTKSASKSRRSTRWQQAPELAAHRVKPTTTSTNKSSAAYSTARDPLERASLAELSEEARIWALENPADPQYCRDRASELLDRRNELYAKAARAYTRRSSKVHHSGTALYYSVEGHKLDLRARMWRMRAAQSAVAAMRNQGANVVDLHGLTREEATIVAMEQVSLWFQGEHHGPLHIVTGMGNHSAGGRACIHPVVVRALEKNGWRYEEGAGFINVLGVNRSRR
ncbi:hypothetical protein GGI07_003793 [Coemansia sp. Benny D115]|nr:hypothetical protein GGI07_003793 [Coemansia sp. Benny D115]